MAPLRKRIFFICGSMNQTTQMHQVSEHLPEYEHYFSPYYVDGPTEMLRRLGLIEFTIAGGKLARRCRDYLQSHGLPIDYQGKSGRYDLVVTCTDLFLRGTSETTGSCWCRRESRTRNPVCSTSSSASPFSLAGISTRMPRGDVE